MWFLGVPVVLLVCGSAWGQDTSCSQYSNGCSTPLHIPMFYKTLFTPSCDRHDACYRCGAKYGISKDTCDSRFLSRMNSACSTHSSQRRDVHSSFSSSGLQKRSACTVIAKDVFYESVHLLGGFFYHDIGDDMPSYCNDPALQRCL